MSIYSVIQAVTGAAGSTDLSSAILYAAGAIVVGVMGWVIRVTQRVDKAITRLTDCLFGYTGKNGLNSDVRTLRRDVNILLGMPPDEGEQ